MIDTSHLIISVTIRNTGAPFQRASHVLVLLLCFFASMTASAQSVSGFVYDETNAPMPFVNVYIKNLESGTSTDAQGRYYLQLRDPGVYDLVFTSIGYETTTSRITVHERENAVHHVWMKTNLSELEEVNISARRRDPAYEIIQQAIDAKDQWNAQLMSSTCDVYIKASEIISEKEKKRRERAEKQEEELAEQTATPDDEDVFAQQQAERKKEVQRIAGSRNMVEVQLKRYYAFPDQIKEVREAYKEYGSRYGLYYISTNEAEFNFYDNLMHVNRLNELPVISPLHYSSVLTYKFHLVGSEYRNGHKVFEIELTPRKRGGASWAGTIWIIDSLFCIEKVDVTLDNDGLMIYNDFRIRQEYEIQGDTIALLKRQEFDYASKTNQSKFQGNTVVRYDDYVLNPPLDKKFFRNEVSVTTAEAYERDTTYWDRIRPEPLTVEEQRYQHVKDSIIAYQSSEQYLDSIDSTFNRVTIMDVAYDGIAFTKRKLKRYYGFNSLLGMVNPWEIGGLRLGPGGYYFQKWKNERFVSTYGSVDVGLRNLDVKYSGSLTFRYDPMHLGYMGIWAGKMFNTIVENDAITNYFQRSNWIEEYRFQTWVRRELVNGLDAYAMVEYVDRLPIDQYRFGQITADWFGGNEPLTFQRYQTVILTLQAQFTPFRKYMTEPYRKVVLGSKWPTFFVRYKRGVPGILGSDINFDYAELGVYQSFKLGTIGTSSYRVFSGKFFNTMDLRYVDYKIFPRGDKYFFASFMVSMQIQDTTLYARDFFIQAHYTHHFNGALTNLIPLVNRLGIHTVAGVSGLYIQDSQYGYFEWFGGVERGFKTNRSRWRIGVYYVDAQSTYSRIQPRIKFAINRYNLRDNSWGF